MVKQHRLELSLKKSLPPESKHLKGQLEPPVSDKQVCVTKNEHFLKRLSVVVVVYVVDTRAMVTVAVVVVIIL